jgi:hypothetical protein
MPSPHLDLTTFFLSISSAAFIGLGIASPDGQSAPQTDMEFAKQNIDLLELMAEKTKGNRTPEEDQLIEQLLFETRLRYVDRQRELATQKKPLS